MSPYISAFLCNHADCLDVEVPFLGNEVSQNRYAQMCPTSRSVGIRPQHSGQIRDHSHHAQFREAFSDTVLALSVCTQLTESRNPTRHIIRYALKALQKIMHRENDGFSASEGIVVRNQHGIKPLPFIHTIDASILHDHLEECVLWLV